MNTTCTNVACYLAGKGAITFPLVTIAGLIDGINPCAIGMLVFLLGYLVVFLNKKSKIFLTALVYILTVYITYLLLGLFLYKFTLIFHLSSYRMPFQKILGVIFFIFGLISIKDMFFPHIGPSLRIPLKLQSRLKNYAKNVSLPTTMLFAFLVTVLKAPCSIPLYVGTAKVLSTSGLPQWAVVAYFLYYNLLFVFPLILIAGVFIKGVNFLTIEDFTHRAQPKMKLIIGLALIGFSLYFFLT
jgi:cytochrome c biogenesis protein CcdA